MERRIDIYKIIVAATICCVWGGPQSALAVSELDEQLPVYGIEIRVSPFRPVFSGNAQVESIRNEVFQDSGNWLKSHPLRYAIEFDFYPVTQAGLLGVYGRAGFWREGAHSRVCFAGDTNVVVQCDAGSILTSQVGADDTALNVVPFSVGAIYRYDMLRRTGMLPLVLSAKAGFEYFLWWSTLGDSASRVGGPNGPLARGGTIGLSGAVQVAFPLDAFKSSPPVYGTREAKQNNYVFLEYSFGYAPGVFQKQPRFDMTDWAIITLGLSIDMT